MSSSRYPNSSMSNEDQWPSKGTVVNVQSSGSAYMKVYRKWDTRNEAELTRASLPGYNQTQDQTGSMLQRWQRESMLDQPYNNMEAVKKRPSHTNDKQVSERSDTKSSLGYFDPQAKPE